MKSTLLLAATMLATLTACGDAEVPAAISSPLAEVTQSAAALASKAGDVASSATAKAGDVASSATAKAGDAASSATAKAGDAASSATAKAGDAASGAASAAASGAPGGTKVLIGTLGDPGKPDAYTIGLTDSSGAAVTTLPAGNYQIKVSDKSKIHNYHFLGESVDETTTVPGLDETTFDVKLTAGTYKYICDPHPRMVGSLTVT